MFDARNAGRLLDARGSRRRTFGGAGRTPSPATPCARAAVTRGCSRAAPVGGADEAVGRAEACGRLCPGAASAVSTATTPVTPSTSRTTFSAAPRSGSSSSARDAGTVIEKYTRPSLTRISETSPRSTILPSRSGPFTRRSRSMTCAFKSDMDVLLVLGSQRLRQSGWHRGPDGLGPLPYVNGGKGATVVM